MLLVLLVISKHLALARRHRLIAATCSKLLFCVNCGKKKREESKAKAEAEAEAEAKPTKANKTSSSNNSKKVRRTSGIEAIILRFRRDNWDS